MLSRLQGTIRSLSRTLVWTRVVPQFKTLAMGSSNRAFTWGWTPRRFFAALPQHKVLAMPNLSPTMTKGTITKWYKGEGEAFIAGDVLCDVETDKATVGFEMVDAGVLAKILVPTGTKDVPLGQPVAVVVDEAKDAAAFKYFKPEAAKAPSKTPPKESPQPAKKDTHAPPPPPKASAPPQTKVESKPEVKVPTQTATLPSQEAYPASPAARKIAAEKNIDLGKVQGTGKHGMVLKEDVLEYIAGGARKPTTAPKQAARPAVPGLPSFVDVDLTNYKHVTAERLSQSKQTVPHFYVSIECEVDKLLELRDFLNKHSKSKISINDMIIKTAAMTCRKVPEANSSWQGTFIRRYKDVDMSVAVQTPSGLVAPIVQRANLKGLQQIAQETKALIDRAKAGKLLSEEIVGGTFTISNAGMYGISQLVPIVNPPQACILGVSQIEKRLEVDPAKATTEKPWRIATKMMVSLCCDHRVVDGAVASEWTKEFKRLIENPDLLLL